MDLFGRAAERAVLDGILADAAGGHGRAIVLRGEAGMGKTALLDRTIAAADGFVVSHIVGVESEMEFGYAALHRLLQPYLGWIDRLPTPQRTALESAFGLAAAPPADRFVAGLATLTLLGEAAAARPLLCVVDDAQWLDRESLEALTLVARRIGADPLALVFGARDRPGIDIDGLTILPLSGLATADAAAMVAHVVDGWIDDRSVDRIVAETAGNPLAIIELTGQLSAAELTARGVTPEPLPLGTRLEAHFRSQIEQLPRQTQRLLLVAAAEPSQDRGLIMDAAHVLGLGADDADPAADVGLFALEATPLFRHSLIRSAAYAGATPGDRRAAHAALARVTDARRDGDRRAWHRAAATVGTSEDVAADLERGAERARARGGYSAAGVYLARAADLTPDAARRSDRLLAAAANHLAGGTPSRARGLLASADVHFADPWQRAVAKRLDGSIAYAAGDMAESVLLLLDAARAFAPLDVVVARLTLLEAVDAARFAGRFCVEGGRDVDIAQLARELPLPPGLEASAPHLLLDGYAALKLDGYAVAMPMLHDALTALSEIDVGGEDSLQWLGTGSWVAGAIGDDDALFTLGSRVVAEARTQGSIVHLTHGLLYLAMANLLRGSLSESRSCFAERSALLTTLGLDGDVGRMIVAGWGGPEDAVRSEIDHVTQLSTERRQGWMLGFVDYARAILELGLGNYAAVVEHNSRHFDDDAFLVIVGYPNIIEAMLRAGRRDEAQAALAVYTDRTKSNATNLSLGLLARVRALLADDSMVDELFAESIVRLARSRAHLQLGRAHLLYGEWLRRQHRPTEARVQLRTAHEIFAERGASVFAERARIELEATGERARARTVDTAGDLTPQERQVATLAADGLTNSEIAAKLFLSPSTVDYHLRKVFRKLDIGSRRRLGRALAALDGANGNTVRDA